MEDAGTAPIGNIKVYIILKNSEWKKKVKLCVVVTQQTLTLQGDDINIHDMP